MYPEIGKIYKHADFGFVQRIELKRFSSYAVWKFLNIDCVYKPIITIEPDIFLMGCTDYKLEDLRIEITDVKLTTLEVLYGARNE